jgi:hypothetical protein
MPSEAQIQEGTKEGHRRASSCGATEDRTDGKPSHSPLHNLFGDLVVPSDTHRISELRFRPRASDLFQSQAGNSPRTITVILTVNP